jgi:hypothetical protein
MAYRAARIQILAAAPPLKGHIQFSSLTPPLPLRISCTSPPVPTKGQAFSQKLPGCIRDRNQAARKEIRAALGTSP